METPSKPKEYKTFTREFDLYSNSTVKEQLLFVGAENEEQIRAGLVGVKIASISGSVNGNPFTIQCGNRLRFTGARPGVPLGTMILYEDRFLVRLTCGKEPAIELTFVANGRILLGAGTIEIGLVTIPKVVDPETGKKESPDILTANRIVAESVVVEVIYDDILPHKAEETKPVQKEEEPKPAPEPEKKPEPAAEVPQPSNDGSIFCCHCGANLTQSKEYVVLKEVEMMFPGPDIVTKYHCCPDCYDFMRKARARVLGQMDGIVDHSKVVRVMQEWFHMFVTEAESKRKLDAERASNAK